MSEICEMVFGMNVESIAKLYYYKNNKAVLCFSPCQSHKCVKVMKAFSNTSPNQNGTLMDVLIDSVDSALKIQLEN